jgi:hypothetical protein
LATVAFLHSSTAVPAGGSDRQRPDAWPDTTAVPSARALAAIFASKVRSSAAMCCAMAMCRASGVRKVRSSRRRQAAGQPVEIARRDPAHRLRYRPECHHRPAMLRDDNALALQGAVDQLRQTVNMS